MSLSEASRHRAATERPAAVLKQAKGDGENAMVTAGWVGDVLGYWFGELTPQDWFETKAETDEAIRRRFLELWQEMREAVPANSFLESEPALAATIVLDQFPRNMFRKQADAFATDRLAQAVAHNALRLGFPDQVGQRRGFLYMPFMHSEALPDQELCVKLFAGTTEQLKYAIEHRDIIARFGRFPHRNRALGRETTEEEREFLQGHAGYGQ
jgi:uncharacterized protein (DUF924 family)